MPRPAIAELVPCPGPAVLVRRQSQGLLVSLRQSEAVRRKARQLGKQVVGQNLLRSALTRDRRGSGSLRKSAGLTKAGETGAGPLSSKASFPAGPSNSWRNLIAFSLLGASFSKVMPHATWAPGTATVRALRGVP